MPTRWDARLWQGMTSVVMMPCNTGIPVAYGKRKEYLQEGEGVA